MTDTYVSYAPGTGTLIARHHTYLLVDAPLGDPAVNRLWSVLEQPDAGEAAWLLLAEVLPQADFCLVEISPTGLRVAQSGVATVLDGRPLVPSTEPTEVAVPAAGGMLMATRGQGAGSLQVPIEGGVVSADSVVVVLLGSEASAPPADAADPDPGLNTQIWADVPEFDESVALADSPLGTVATAVPSGLSEETLHALDPEDLAANDPSARLALAPPPEPGSAVASHPVIEDPTTDTVLAGICLNGHVSGAHAPTCRVCGDPLPPQTPRTVARPPLGVLVLQDGTTVQLDRGAVLGRAPRVPEEATERPHLVNLAAYGRDVSRQHAEVLVQGWSVFVRDLGSANGTRLHDPSGSTTALQPGDPVALVPDSLIDIAEVTTIQYRTA